MFQTGEVWTFIIIIIAQKWDSLVSRLCFLIFCHGDTLSFIGNWKISCARVFSIWERLYSAKYDGPVRRDVKFYELIVQLS